MSQKPNHNLAQDFFIIAASITLAVFLVRAGVLSEFLTATQNMELLGSFVAGMFFTSVFTTAPAIAAFGTIAAGSSLLQTALVGAAGAVLGDLLIFRFVKDRFAEDFMALLRERGMVRRLRHLLRSKLFQQFTFFLGGLIIASPLPDELGIALLGFTKLKTSRFIPVSFVFNFLGILVIGLVARAI